MHEAFGRDLALLESQGRLRSLAPRLGHDFSSNDYLGLAQSTDLRSAALAAIERGVPVGAGGSRLLRGNHPEHEALEAEAAAFFGAESALFFGSGFAANWSLFATLPQRGDLVVYDALIHASAHQGMQAGRAETVSVDHNDASAFEHAIRKWRQAGGVGTAWIAVESLYSMDGDRAPLADLMRIADANEAMLIIDEAHATGVFGEDGRGQSAAFEGRENVLSLHTFGKALGASGGVICGPRVFRDFLVNRCKPFIYSTAPSPLDAALARASLTLCRDADQPRDSLAHVIAIAGDALKLGNLPVSGSQIQPVIVGSDRRATALASAMQADGFDIRAIRPPTVPEGTARVRIALTLNVDETVVREMLTALVYELARLEA